MYTRELLVSERKSPGMKEVAPLDVWGYAGDGEMFCVGHWSRFSTYPWYSRGSACMMVS
mgnify:CR=1 FL=1